MTKVYVLFYDHDGTGDREEWNTFHTPCEVFATDADRSVRMSALLSADPDLCFHELDLEMPPSAAVAGMGSGPNAGGSGSGSGVSNGLLDDMRMTPEQEMEHIKENTENAPKDYFTAVKRVMEIEMRLEDLSRAAEIAAITGQMELITGFREAADASLATKMSIKREATGDMNLTVITGQLDPTLAGNLSGNQQPQTI